MNSESLAQILRPTTIAAEIFLGDYILLAHHVCLVNLVLFVADA